MNKDKKILIIRILLALAILAMMIVIFLFSAERGAQSSQTSSSVTETVVEVVVPNYDTLPAEQKVSIFEKAHSFIRKCAHFFNFMVLGMLVCCFLETFKFKRNYLIILISLGYCMLYAISDEIHQMFVPDRGPSVKDVFIDSSGSLLGIVFIFLLFVIIKYFINKKAQQN